MIKITLLFTALLSMICLSTECCARGLEVQGQVRQVDGQPVAKVAVTDGYKIVFSDHRGHYRIIPSPLARFVYITVPAGFEMSAKNNGGNFYIPLPKEGTTDAFNFVLEPIGIDSTHAFFVLGDPQVYNAADVQRCALFAADIKNYKDSALRNIPVHGMVVGDMVGDRPDLFVGVKQVFELANMNYFFSKGNHDLRTDQRSNTTASMLYEENFGPRYYAFDRGSMHYIVLDDVFYLGRGGEYVGYICEEQFRWLRLDLQKVPKGNTIVMMFHIPTASKDFRKIERKQQVVNAKHLYTMLKDYKVHILSGHTHLHDHFQPAPRIMEHNQASISGIFWQEKNSCADGTPVGYSVYVAKGDSLTWRYKSLGLPDNIQSRAYGLGENPERPNELTALVWNYDNVWRVSWYEDGVYAGEMQQFIGHDPQTRKKIVENKNKYAYDWIWTTTTDHLFAAKPLNPDSEMMILVEDRFGIKYKTYVQQKKDR